MRTERWCCWQTCKLPAAWTIYANEAHLGDDDYTDACTAHVGALLTDAYCHLVYRIEESA